MIASNRLDDVSDAIARFREEREWERYHTPRNLMVAIAIEAAELLECIQWKSDDEIFDYVSGEGLDRVSEEIADVAIYLCLLCNDLDLNVVELMEQKLEKNRQKYPVDKSKGSSKKYDEI